MKEGEEQTGAQASVWYFEGDAESLLLILAARSATRSTVLAEGIQEHVPENLLPGKPQTNIHRGTLLVSVSL